MPQAVVAGIGFGVGLAAEGIAIGLGASKFVAGIVGAGANFLVLWGLREDDKDEPASNRGDLTQYSVQNRQVTTRQYSNNIVYGETTVFPTLKFIESASQEGSSIFLNENQSIPPNVPAGPYTVIMYGIASHEIEEILWTKLGNIFVQPDPITGFSLSPNFNLESGPFVAESRRLGTEDQLIDPIIVRNFPNKPNTYRQIGYATVTHEYFMGETQEEQTSIWSEAENPGVSLDVSVRVKGAKVFDPTDPIQDHRDPSTWQWTENAALIKAHSLTTPLFINKPITYDDVDLEDLKRTAKICMKGRPARDRFLNETTRITYQQPQYTISADIKSNQVPAQTLDQMRLSSDGDIIQSEGKYKIVVGHRRDPVMTISDKNLFGRISFGKGFTADRQVGGLIINGPSGTSRLNDSTIQTDVISDLPEPEIKNNINHLTIPFSEGVSRLYRLGKIRFNQSKLDKVLSINVDNLGLILEPWDVVRIFTEKFARFNGLYVILAVAPSTDERALGEAYELVVQEYNHGIWNWNVNEDEGEFVYPT